MADTALKLGMKVIGFDPEITVDAAWRLPGSVRRANSIEEVMRQADYVTLHVPLFDKTRHLIDARRLAVDHVDGHHVKPARRVVQMVTGQVIDGHLRDALLLAPRDRRRRAAEIVPGARLHFHEDRRLAVAGDDVNFSVPGAISARKNCVPAAPQLGAGQIFSHFPERVAWILVPERTLRTVYRSMDEQVFRHLNEQFYGGRLSRLPHGESVTGTTPVLDVEYVPDGVGALTAGIEGIQAPAAEVRRVVELVFEHAEQVAEKAGKDVPHVCAGK